MQRIPLFLLSTALLLLGSASTAAAQDTEAERILPLGGSVTEIVYALGEGERVVGVDASSVYPEAATEKPDVGYYRQLSAEGVLSLNPALILALEGTGPPAVLDQLRSADVRVETIADEPTVEGAKQKIRRVAELLGRADAGDELIAEMERQLSEARTLREEADATPHVLFIYARGSGTMNVAGSGTSAEAMIELAGAENALTGIDGFKPLTAEAVVEAEPDVILMLTRGLDSVGGVEGVLEQPGIELTPAGENCRIVAMDDLLLLGFGPRLGTAVRALTEKLHPQLEAASASAE
ncbi:hemin ABC transporter substrate-binding protein [Longimonas halophila]|uniref:Hemin ABC transporter substrate-binding protein n=1 Tax=Longimonas halophila TaxID=1469170 RepID=A0A2H3NYC6_9BACT|nr:hemin ABC transporter substrate-binding protein [Longimonas halophila]PEN07737.1 hemin ABC transporter substrate-binding protein [Longimonas halophila]